MSRREGYDLVTPSVERKIILTNQKITGFKEGIMEGINGNKLELNTSKATDSYQEIQNITLL